VKWLIVNTNYPEFTQWLYARHPGLAARPYAEQWRACMASLFGITDAYSANLQSLGEQAWDVIANNLDLQRAWAREQGLARGRERPWKLRWRRGVLPWFHRPSARQQLYDILEAQVRHYRPDVFYCMAIEYFDSAFVRRIRDVCRIVVGQHAAEIPPVDLSAYDLMLTSLPNQADLFRRRGLAAETLRLAFDPRVLQHLNGQAKTYDIVFAGGVAGVHDFGTQVLLRLCEAFDVRIWGYGAENLPAGSPARARCHPPLWGRDMFQAFRQARIVFNRHSRVAEQYANNMRLFEATGVGSLLLTDQKCNLAELFEPGRECVAYRDADECMSLARHYLDHDDEREQIAQAGQARTLREHAYAQRMAELIEIVRARI
jgi:hypothetical protein